MMPSHVKLDELWTQTENLTLDSNGVVKQFRKIVETLKPGDQEQWSSLILHKNVVQDYTVIRISEAETIVDEDAKSVPKVIPYIIQDLSYALNDCQDSEEGQKNFDLCRANFTDFQSLMNKTEIKLNCTEFDPKKVLQSFCIMMRELHPTIPIIVKRKRIASDTLNTDCQRFQQVLLLVLNLVITKISGLKIIHLNIYNMNPHKKEDGIIVAIKFDRDQEDYDLDAENNTGSPRLISTAVENATRDRT